MYFPDWQSPQATPKQFPRKLQLESGDDCVMTMDAVEFHCPNKNCTKVFNWRSNLTRHMKYECGKSPRFRCSRCEYQSPFKQHVLRHASAKHPNQLTEAINQQQNLPNNQPVPQPDPRLVPPELIKPEPPGQFVCSNLDCNAAFANLYALNYHTSYMCDKPPKYQQVSMFYVPEKK